jgi:hypothetical protein
MLCDIRMTKGSAELTGVGFGLSKGTSNVFILAE